MRAVGGPTADPAEHDRYCARCSRTEPDLLLDNGGDLFVRWLEAPYDGLRGGTEETTSGRMRLDAAARRRSRMPVLVINDSPIKQFAENKHAVGAGHGRVVHADHEPLTNGRRVTVFGYGAVGTGVAAHFRNAFAEVSVVEVDPVTRLEALLDGFAVPGRGRALGERRRRHHRHRRAEGVLARRRPAAARATASSWSTSGHFPLEIDVPASTATRSPSTRIDPATASRRSASPTAAGCTS